MHCISRYNAHAVDHPMFVMHWGHKLWCTHVCTHTYSICVCVLCACMLHVVQSANQLEKWMQTTTILLPYYRNSIWDCLVVSNIRRRIKKSHYTVCLMMPLMLILKWGEAGSLYNDYHYNYSISRLTLLLVDWCRWWPVTTQGHNWCCPCMMLP